MTQIEQLDISELSDFLLTALEQTQSEAETAMQAGGAALFDAYENARKDVEQLRRERDDARSNQTISLKEYDKAERDSLRQQVERLDELLDVASRELQDREQFEQERDQLRAELDELQESMTHAEMEISDRGELLASLRAQLEEARTEMAYLKLQRDRLLEITWLDLPAEPSESTSRWQDLFNEGWERKAVSDELRVQLSAANKRAEELVESFRIVRMENDRLRVCLDTANKHAEQALKGGQIAANERSVAIADMAFLRAERDAALARVDDEKKRHWNTADKLGAVEFALVQSETRIAELEAKLEQKK
jgi:regulator of replication initiation timing